MTLLLSFLAGLLLLLSGDLMFAGLPMPEVPVEPLLVYATALPLAFFGGYLSVLVTAGRLQRGRPLWPSLLLSPGLPLLIWLLLLGPGQLQEVVGRRVDSQSLGLLISFLPLVVLELLSTAGQQRAARLFLGLGDLRPGPLRLRVMLLICLGVLLFGLLQDLCAQGRWLYVFINASSLGVFASFAVLVVGLVLLMPPLVVALLPTRRELPGDVLYTATQLGFSPRHVFSVETDGRIVNAGLLGILPGLRYLLLSDGLLRLLQPFARRGVVAHEVGHARAMHPLWLVLLFFVVPVLLFLPLQYYLLADLGEGGSLLLLLGLGLPGLLLFRRLSHRFEFEADQISSEVLGGAAPCIVALQSISSRFDLPRDKASMRHPSEDARIQHLLWWDGDPGYRARFGAGGRRWRRNILIALAVAAVLGVLANLQVWRLEKPYLQLYTGDFAGAQASLLSLSAEREQLPRVYVESLREIEEELDAAQSLQPAGGEWSRIRGSLGQRALQRAHQVLAARGPAAARPWFALALVSPDSGPAEVCYYRLCAAAQAEDPARLEEVRQHLLEHFALSEARRQVLQLLGRAQ